MLTALIVAVLSATATAVAAPEAHIVAAPNSPVRLDSAKVINTDAEPLVLLYAATNASGAPLEVFTVVVFVFDAQGQLKGRQVAPGRRELGVGETKYSAMVLDVGKIEATDTLLAGVDQAQRVGSDEWWRADLRLLAQQAADAQRGAATKKPK